MAQCSKESRGLQDVALCDVHDRYERTQESDSFARACHSPLVVGSGTPTYAFAFFLPSIVSMLGKSFLYEPRKLT